MSPQHLSPEVVQRYRQKSLSPHELIATADHLAICPECRELLAAASDLSNRIHSLRSEFITQTESNHLSYADLESYVDGTLEASRLQALDAHLMVCGRCSEELQDLESYRLHLAIESRTSEAFRVGRLHRAQPMRTGVHASGADDGVESADDSEGYVLNEMLQTGVFAAPDGLASDHRFLTKLEIVTQVEGLLRARNLSPDVRDRLKEEILARIFHHRRAIPPAVVEAYVTRVYIEHLRSPHEQSSPALHTPGGLIGKIRLNRWQLYLCWAGLATLLTLAVMPFFERNMVGEVMLWVLTIVAKAFAVGLSAVRRVFVRYFFLNLYWILSVAAFIAEYYALSQFGFGSSELAKVSICLWGALAVVLFLAIVQLALRILGTNWPGKKTALLVTSCFFLATVSFSFLNTIDSGGVGFLMVRLSENLLWAGMVPVALVWGWRFFHKPADWIADKLLAVLGSCQAIWAVTWWIQRSNLIAIPVYLGPLVAVACSIASCLVLITRSPHRLAEALQVPSRTEALERAQ